MGCEELRIGGMSLFEFITLIIIFAGLVVACIQLMWQQPKRRHTGFLLDLMQTWRSDSFVEARRIVNQYAENLGEAIEKYDKENEPEYYTLIKVANFFEDLGTLVRRGELTKQEIRDYFSESIEHYYHLYSKYIERHRQDILNLYKGFENLAKGD
jgi:hypothetical protein